MKSLLVEEANDLVIQNKDLPHRLYFGRFRSQWVANYLDEDECISVGLFELVRASRQWQGIGPFRDYATVSIIHAVNKAARREARYRELEEVYLPSSCNAELARYEDAEVILLLLPRLSENDRALLTDKILLNLTFQQMAEKRGISKTNVQKWYDIALIRAREITKLLTGECCNGAT